MTSTLTLLPYLAPLALIGAATLAFRGPGLRPRRTLRAATGAAAFALLAALGLGATVVAFGPLSSPMPGIGDLALGLRLDALSAIMAVLVSFVGLIVVAYSRNYLDGEARQGAFTGWLCLTLAAVWLLVTAGTLVQLVLAWLAMSLALDRLLVFYAERPAARLAARKKFILARIGDGCLIGAAVLLWLGHGTVEIGAILAAAGGGAIPAGTTAAAGLIAVAALLKSAQFPTHGWLIEVMETPTPVSALLHAGVVNAGGFLVLRFADVMLASAASMHLLAIVGGFTALVGSVVMLTQTSVKVSLAWSTVAQMGFMMLQCGLGAFSAALLHIVAHSLYKAHAFLSSGSVVDLARAAWVPSGEGAPRPVRFIASLAVALGLFAGVGWLVGASPAEKPAIVALGAILVMGLTLLLAEAMAGRGALHVLGRTAVAATGVAGVWFALQYGAAALTAGTLPPEPAPDALSILLMALAVASFGALTVLQILAPYRSGSPVWRAARVHLANGLYANAFFNRLVARAARP